MNEFREIWLVDFAYSRPAGERPRPLSVVAREFRTARLALIKQESPPYSVGPESLFVTYDAPAALGCHLALGWPLPARILDLHAEFRCLTSGLLEPGDYTLQDALTYFKLLSAGPENRVEDLAKLLSAMLPRIDLPRAVQIRGRYTAAVARMEATGIPIDVESLNRIRNGWNIIR